MTVAELVAELQEMPQDMEVYVYDSDRSAFPAERLTIEATYAWDYQTRINLRGESYIDCVPGSMRVIDAVFVE